MKKIFRKEVLIGLIVIACLVILFVGIDFLKGINLFKAANYYYASYENVEGLTVSSPVTLNGYKVGQVREINYEYDNPGHVLVEMSLDRQLRVPAGSEALLASDILGTASIQLRLAPGTNGYHNVGDRLKGVNSPSLLAGLGDDLMPKIGRTLELVDTLLASVNVLASDPALLASVRRLDGISADLAATTAQIRSMAGNLPPIVGDVKSITGDVRGITGNALTMTGDLTHSSADIKELTASLSSQMQQAHIDSLLNNVSATAANLRQLSAALTDKNSTLGLLLNDPALYNNLNRSVKSLDSLFVDIKRNPKRYISIKIF